MAIVAFIVTFPPSFTFSGYTHTVSTEKSHSGFTDTVTNRSLFVSLLSALSEGTHAAIVCLPNAAGVHETLMLVLAPPFNRGMTMVGGKNVALLPLVFPAPSPSMNITVTLEASRAP